MALTDLSDEELVSRLEAICLEGHRLMARLIVHLAEVEERRLDLRAACSSLFDFCVRRLGMSEGAAFRRINAARLVKRFPCLLARIERGELALSTLVLLRPHLTEDNVNELAQLVAGRTLRQVEEIIARIAPRPDVLDAIVALQPRGDLHVQVPLPAAAPAASGTPPRARIEPLSEARYKVQLTASRALRDKLERACRLMGHRNPSGDLAVVVERALDLLLERLERERLGKATRPSRRAPKTARGSGISRAARREVFARDGEQCTFVDGEGRRCPARTLLELDHVESRALGGANTSANLRVRCRPHNRLHAEEVFGREHVARAVDFRQRNSRRVIDVPDGPSSAMAMAAAGTATAGAMRWLAQRTRPMVLARREHRGMRVPASIETPGDRRRRVDVERRVER